VVDEAVFAVAEQKPGFAKVFFYLEQEVMKPRYEIHSLSMNDVVEPAQTPQLNSRTSPRAHSSPRRRWPTPQRSTSNSAAPCHKTSTRSISSAIANAFENQVSQLAAQLTQQIEQKPGKTDLVKAFAALKRSARSAPTSPKRSTSTLRSSPTATATPASIPHRRLHHHLAHGHARLHAIGCARQQPASSSLKVFQDFFVDLDLPVTLTQGDRVSIPVAVYNYSGKPGRSASSSSPTTGTRSNNDTPKNPSPSNPARSAARSSLSTPTASANSSSRSPPTWTAAPRSRRHRRPRD
jgi:hypothetical protein